MVLLRNVWLAEDAAHTVDILTEGQKIKKIGPALEATQAKVIDGSGCVALPGLVNAHSHSPMSLFRGFADDLKLSEWLTKHLFPAEDKLTAEDAYWGSLLSCVEMLKSGTTTFHDEYFFMEQVAQAVQDSGIRGHLAISLAEGGYNTLDKALAFAASYQGAADGRIHTGLAAHAPYTCGPEFLQQIAAAARENGYLLGIHLAETRDEIATMQERYGKTTVRLMADIGLFEGPVLASHLIWVDEDEIAILAENNVTAAHCPQSNMKLASGIAPVDALLTAGVKVALGTDSACSNNRLDLFQEMKAAALLGKVKAKDAAALSAATVLAMATEQGAKALDWPGLGLLQEGALADIILVDMAKPHLTPLYQPVSHLVYAVSGSDVKTVMVNGELLVVDGKLIQLDEEEICAKATACSKKFR